MTKPYTQANAIERAAVEADEPAENVSVAVASICAVIALVTGIELDPVEVAGAVVAVGVVAKVATKIVKKIRDRFGFA